MMPPGAGSSGLLAGGLSHRRETKRRQLGSQRQEMPLDVVLYCVAARAVVMGMIADLLRVDSGGDLFSVSSWTLASAPWGGFTRSGKPQNAVQIEGCRPQHY